MMSKYKKHINTYTLKLASLSLALCWIYYFVLCPLGPYAFRSTSISRTIKPVAVATSKSHGKSLIIATSDSSRATQPVSIASCVVLQVSRIGSVPHIKLSQELVARHKIIELSSCKWVNRYLELYTQTANTHTAFGYDKRKQIKVPHTHDGQATVVLRDTSLWTHIIKICSRKAVHTHRAVPLQLHDYSYWLND